MHALRPGSVQWKWYTILLAAAVCFAACDNDSDPQNSTVMAEPGAVAQIVTVSGNDQIATVHEKLPQHLKVKANDSFGNPIADAPVKFTVIVGDGIVENGSVVTGADGIAESGAWTLGSTEGQQQVRAESGGIHTLFSAVALPVASVPTGLSGRVAFVTHRDGNSEIYTVNADGTDLRRLTTYRGGDGYPAYSPDGSQIAYTRDGFINIMTAEGSNIGRLAIGSEPAWSPDGAAIALSTLHNGNASIATRDDGDAAVAVLTTEPGYHGQPSWSPDGQKIAFVSDWVAYDFASDIYTMSTDGSARLQLTHGFNFWPNLQHFLHPAWSPDGTMIAFVYGSIVNGSYEVQIDSDMRFRVAIMSADGTFIRDLAWAGDIPWVDLLDPGSLTWSPDGLVIAYSFVDCDRVLKTGCSKARSVRYVSLDGSLHGTIVEDGYNPSWSH